MIRLAAIALALLPLAALPQEAPPPEHPRANGPATDSVPVLEPGPAPRPGPAPPADEGAEPSKRVELDYELDPYYTTASVFLSLTDEPIPHVGEKGELEMYLALLPRAFSPSQLVPRFIVLEASVNPLPCLGLVVRDRWPGFYGDAEVYRNLNWVKAVTAGFEEPYAVSILGGQFVNFDVAGRDDVKGKGYGGLLVSVGTHHIKDNQLYRDDWIEIESKVKGDRKSPVKKLSWSFRVGAKFHSNPYIADIVYLGLRRSRLDFVESPDLVFANLGFEYRFDVAVDRIAADGLRPARHVLLVDKKLLLPRTKLALTLQAGFVYTLADAYRGPLARSGQREDFQFVLRPNLDF